MPGGLVFIFFAIRREAAARRVEAAGPEAAPIGAEEGPDLGRGGRLRRVPAPPGPDG